MKKLHNQQKFDLESIDFVKSIDDNQAETLSAGASAPDIPLFTISTRDNSFSDIVSGERPESTNTSIAIDSRTRSLGINQQSSASNTDVVMATFIDDDTGAIVNSRNVRSGGRVRRREILEAVSEGADTLVLQLLG